MYVINKDQLNPLEKNIYSILLKKIRQNNKLSITEAAEACNCSPSKISKFIHKLGFENYKKYLNFINGNTFSVMLDEQERLKVFLNDFNPQVVKKFINYLQKFEKIILLGYGPSFIISQYFEYKLRIISDAPAWAVPDETSVDNLLTENSLVIVFSVTGQFKSFKTLYEKVISKGGKVVFILEEGVIDFLEFYDFVIILTNQLQNPSLIPHEKNRTIFLIFIEAVIKLMREESSKLRNGKKLS